ncbi:Hvo_1808 family surface protein [Natranaeroarchaeum sulfidigenes]|uniref:Hvo_1808 family surface protein n=1 Tax=Natranaeroarchaeum sulfidigenes TaxID=2784880 RepID=UPI001EE53311|nr:Hvo_1808 family surface protein [Natranaeroarchaeum sulfidigenes]
MAVPVTGGVPGDDTTAGVADTLQPDESVIHECAAEPPEDHADPEEDVLGWSNGYWYDEQLDINTTDGLDEDELDALVARTEARIEAIRCLPFENETDVDVITREEFEEETEAWDSPEDVQRFEDVVYRAMLLVDEEDPQEVQQENLGTGVGGYYDPATEQIVVIAEDEESLEFDETLLAHELGHALQDQHFDLGRFDEQTIDGSLADEGLIEGDVVYVEQLYEHACEDGAWEGTCVEVADPEQPTPDDLANIGLYLLSFQPYSDGPAFVDDIYEYEPGERAAGDWEPVDELYDDPPGTSAEIISPDRYPNYESTNVTASDNSTDEWEQLTVEDRPDYETVGKAGLSAMFAYPTFAPDVDESVIDQSEFQDDGTAFSTFEYRHEYVTGWNGDRLQPYENDAGETSYVWTTEWETEADAQTFRVGYDRLLDNVWGMERVDGQAGTYESDDAFAGAYYVDREGDRVSIVHAPTIEQLGELEPDAESTTEWELPQSTPSNDADDGDEIPGFGIGVAVVGILGTLLVVRRWAA